MNYKIFSRSIVTSHMLEILMDLHEKELMNLEPSDASTVPPASALMKRNLIEPTMYVYKYGKKIVGQVVSSAGKFYLQQVCSKM